jgi:hypothetical protein
MAQDDRMSARMGNDFRFNAHLNLSDLNAAPPLQEQGFHTNAAKYYPQSSVGLAA